MFINTLHNWFCSSFLIQNKTIECFDFSVKQQIISVHRVLITIVTRSQLILKWSRMLVHCFSEGPKTVQKPFCRLDSRPAEGMFQHPQHVQDTVEIVCREEVKSLSLRFHHFTETPKQIQMFFTFCLRIIKQLPIKLINHHHPHRPIHTEDNWQRSSGGLEN